jgi:outer membrane protein
MHAWIRAVSLATALAAVGAPLAAQAPTTPPAPTPKPAVIGEGSFLVRLRGMGFITADKSTAAPVISLQADRITLSDVVMPELELTWFPIAKLGVSLSGSIPQAQKARLSGTPIGTFKRTPLAALLQYHARPRATIRPYVGAGVAVAMINDVDLPVQGLGRLTLPDAAVGPVGQLGVDFRIATGILLNIDARYSLLETDLKSGVNRVSTLSWNPIQLGGGIGFRF